MLQSIRTDRRSAPAGVVQTCAGLPGLERRKRNEDGVITAYVFASQIAETIWKRIAKIASETSKLA